MARTGDLISGDADLGDVKFAKVDDAAGGTVTVVAALAGKQIRLLAAVLGGAATVWQWKSATTALSGAITHSLDLTNVLPFSPVGWLETAVGEALILETTGAIDGHITYLVI